MKQIMLFMSIISCFFSFYLCSATICDLKLELLQVVFRHGARRPTLSEALHLNFTDPTAYGPEGYCQLTKEGKRQAYKLGTMLRRRYDEFLGAYNPREYQAASTVYSRTVMSLQLVLAGLFPPSPKDSWNKKIYWRPVPFQRNSAESDITLAPYLGQKYIDLYYKTMADSSEFQDKLAKYTEFLESMDNKTGFPLKKFFLTHPSWTYHAIKYHKEMNLPLPNWYTDDSIYTTLSEIVKLSWDSMSMTPKLKRLSGGPLVRKVIENINENRKAALPKKIYLYCAHDATLHVFSKAQYFDAFHIPPSSSALIMEKYTDSDKAEYVRMLAWDGFDENFMTIRIGNCDEFCPFDEYLKIVKLSISSDEDLDYLKNNLPAFSIGV